MTRVGEVVEKTKSGDKSPLHGSPTLLLFVREFVFFYRRSVLFDLPLTPSLDHQVVIGKEEREKFWMFKIDLHPTGW